MRAKRAWPELGAAAALVAAGLALALAPLPLHHDVVWQLWVGGRLGEGASLYRDIVEVNPPLWFWLAEPLVGFAASSGLREDLVLKLFFVALAGAALALAARLLRDRAPAERALIHAAALLAFFVWPLASFGQREHLTLIATLPYVLLAARRAAGREAPAALAAAVGLLAAAGLALKPHFLAAPLALEAWLLFARGRGWTPFRPEAVALGAGLAAYGAAVLVAAPDYLASVVPMLRAAYGAHDRPLGALLLDPLLLLWPLAVSAVALAGRRASRIWQAAFLASLAFLVAYIVQRKGWSYQLVPAVGLMIVAAGAELAALARGLAARRRRAAALALASVVLLPTAAAVAKGPYANQRRAAAEQALAGLPAGEAVIVYSIHASAGWPMVMERELRWGSRYFQLWMLPGIARAERSGRWPPGLRRVAAEVRRHAARDVACAAPARILVDGYGRDGLLPSLGFDTLAFFRAEPAFAAVFGRYRFARRAGTLDVYERVGPPRRPAGCPTIG